MIKGGFTVEQWANSILSQILKIIPLFETSSDS